MSNRRILGFTWLAFAAILWLVLHRFVQWIWIDLMGRASLVVGGNEFITVPGVVSLVLIAAVAYWSWKHQEIHDYSIATIAELRKVVWPGRDELRDSTIVVIASVVVFAAIADSWFDFRQRWSGASARDVSRRDDE